VEFSVFDFSFYLGVSDCVAESVGSMGVAVVIYIRFGHEIGFPVDEDREIATFAFHLEIALPARRFNDCSFD